MSKNDQKLTTVKICDVRQIRRTDDKARNVPPVAEAWTRMGAMPLSIRTRQSLAGRQLDVQHLLKTDAKEMTVSANERLTASDYLGRVSLDWWATIVAGAVVLLAVAGLLPKIPW